MEIAEQLYRRVTGEEKGARVCRDIPPEACDAVPRNFLRLLLAQVATKTGDALSKPGLVLTWLLSVLGAPAGLIGLVAPVREAGSMLPQLLISGIMRRFAIRKGLWVLGALLQGLCVIGMAAAAVGMRERSAAAAIVILLALFSLSRGICSVVSKDLLGRTIPKTRRGRLGGLAASLAGWMAVGAGILFTLLRGREVPVGLFAMLLLVAGILWIFAAAVMASLEECPVSTDRATPLFAGTWKNLGLLRSDAVFRRFCIARALLASTVLSMPFYVVLAHRAAGGEIAGLGLLMIAGSSATALSGAAWGWMADRSSRITLAAAGAAAGLIGLLTAGLAGLALSQDAASWLYAGLFFAIGLAHTGIRLGRKTYLVDMVDAENRASYVALSNTLIGLVLLLSGSFGLLGEPWGERVIIAVFALLGLVGAGLAWTLPEVQEESA